MNRDELIDVFQDTVNRVTNDEYPFELQSELVQLGSIPRLKMSLGNLCNIDVENEDCIVVADKLSKIGKTCMLNMASHKTPGGGVARGSMAQEEELARRSNLVFGLPIEHYPLSETELIYTKDVSFFKDKWYNIIPEFKCDVITIPAINRMVATPKDYESLTRNKIKNMLYAPHKNGCTNLVLSAFGCGVFKNDPRYISELFKLLDSGYSELYDNITFAIINDRNSVSSNFEIFKNILKY